MKWAWMLYQRQVRPDGVIPADNSTLLESVEQYESEAIDFLKRTFVLEEGKHVLSSRMDELLRQQFITLNNYAKAEWGKAWERYGVKWVRKRCNGEKRWMFEGIRERTAQEKVVEID